MEHERDGERESNIGRHTDGSRLLSVKLKSNWRINLIRFNLLKIEKRNQKTSETTSTTMAEAGGRARRGGARQSDGVVQQSCHTPDDYRRTFDSISRTIIAIFHSCLSVCVITLFGWQLIVFKRRDHQFVPSQHNKTLAGNCNVIACTPHHRRFTPADMETWNNVG